MTKNPNNDGEASDPCAPDLELTDQICFDKVKKERDELRAALERAQEALGKAHRAQINTMYRFALMTRPQDIRLAAGEMTAQEMRTARAIANWYLSTARSLLSQPTEGV